MKTVKLGNTGIVVPKNGFGALPIQRIGKAESTSLLRKAYRAGFRFFDTARFYTDSEEKLGAALGHVRGDIVIASKTMAGTADEFEKQLGQTLAALGSDYLDLYQFHNPKACPKPGDGSGLYEAMLEAKAAGRVRHIGISNHRLPVAKEAAESGLYETLQYPFSYLASEAEIELARLCERKKVGFIAMKALAGGLIANSAAAFAFIDRFDGVLPIWGIQRESELDEFIAHGDNPPALEGELAALVERDRRELSGDFCRGCGYCLPCQANIDIPTCARMSLMVRRAPVSVYLSEDWKRKMAMIDSCAHCDACKSRCPYGLDTPALLAANWADYRSFM